MRARDKLMSLNEEEAFVVAMVLDLFQYDVLERIKFYKAVARDTRDQKNREYWLAESEELQRRYDIIYGEGV